MPDPAIGDYSARVANLTVEIFSAPKPFVDNDIRSNERAIKTWLALSIQPRITLLGNETGYAEAARKFRLNHIPNVDRSFLNVPLFNSLIHHANSSNCSIAVFVNGDILLYDDFINSVLKAAAKFRHFLTVAARHDIQSPPPRHKGISTIRHYARRRGTLHSYGGVDVWAWNTDGPPLISPGLKIPPFVFGRGRYDNWITHEAIAASSITDRHVVDISESACLLHVRHDYHLVERSSGQTLERNVPDDFWAEDKHTKFELFINVYLSTHSGTYSYQKGSALFAPWKLSHCVEFGGICILKRSRPGVCNCEYSPFSANTMTDPVVTRGTRIIRCGRVIVENIENYTIPVTLDDGKDVLVRAVEARKVKAEAEGMPFDESIQNKNVTAFGLPLTLRAVARRVAVNDTIVLTAITNTYRQMLMNWVCNLRLLGISNYMIAAFDKPVYQFGFLNSLPIFYDERLPHAEDELNLTKVEYGSDAFRIVTKLKTRVVYHVIRAGYNVIWCDVDIILFSNPIVDLWSRPGDLVMQSNAPDGVPMNRRRRLNSGFYLAKARRRVLRALREIIMYAASAPELSEQPCVYDILCGQHAEFSVGEDSCVYRNVTTRILPREVYPNGVTESMWNASDGSIRDKWPNIVLLHNNWIVGYEAKWERFVRHGFVLWNEDTGLCQIPTKW